MASNLRPASFRDVPFGVKEHEIEGGRRTVSHEFPYKPDPYVEDMGLKQKTFTLEAFVVGDDYMDKRNALIAALEQEGPGTLVHPFYGEITLQVDTFRIKESMSDRRMASFSITFKQTGRINYPVSEENKVSTVADAAAAANEAAAVAAANAIDVSDGRVAASLETSAANTVATTRNGLAGSMSKSARARGALESFDAWTRDINNLATNVSAYIRRPLDFIYRFQSVVGRLVGIADNARDAIRSYVRLYNSVVAAFDAIKYRNTPRGAQARVNDKALLSMTTVAIAGASAEAAAVATYETSADADSVLSGILGMLDRIMYETTDDDLYNRVMDLRIALSNSVPPDIASLRRVTTKVLPESLPALVVSFQTYGTVDFADEIVERNRVRHPGAVPGGQVLELLT